MDAKWSAKLVVRIVHDDRIMFKMMRMLLDANERAQAPVVLGLSDPLAQVGFYPVERRLRWIASRCGGAARLSANEERADAGALNGITCPM